MVLLVKSLRIIPIPVVPVSVIPTTVGLFYSKIAPPARLIAGYVSAASDEYTRHVNVLDNSGVGFTVTTTFSPSLAQLFAVVV